MTIIIIYLIIGLFTALLVAAKSNTPFTSENFLPLAIIMAGWPVPIVYLLHLTIKKVSGENVVRSNKDSSNTNCSTDIRDYSVEDTVEEVQENPRKE